MGKTIIPFNQLVRHIKEENWSKFRRALAKDDQERLDQLFEMARFHSAPASQQSHSIPMEVILMGMFLEILKRFESLEEKFPKG